MKQKLLLLGLLVLIGVGVYFFRPQKNAEIHIHAGFKVFVDGKYEDFSSILFMSLIPCGEHAKTRDPAIEQIEKAHLHDQVGTVVHVHRKQALWRDLFTNLNYEIDVSKPLVAYVDGQIVSDIFNKTIEPYESVIILIGENGDPAQYLSQAVQRQEIEAVEAIAESCGSNK